jgi:hypothetical protein
MRGDPTQLTASRTRGVRLPSGVVRALKPRLESSSTRCGQNLVRYIESLLQRVGPNTARIRLKVWLHDRNVVKISYKATMSFPPSAKKAPGRPSAPLSPKLRASLSAAGASPERILALLWIRLDRLLRYSAVRYGKIVLEIASGRIEMIGWTRTCRPDQDEPSSLDSLFAGAPSSVLARLGQHIGIAESVGLLD